MDKKIKKKSPKLKLEKLPIELQEAVVAHTLSDSPKVNRAKDVNSLRRVNRNLKAITEFVANKHFNEAKTYPLINQFIQDTYTKLQPIKNDLEAHALFHEIKQKFINDRRSPNNQLLKENIASLELPAVWSNQNVQALRLRVYKLIQTPPDTLTPDESTELRLLIQYPGLNIYMANREGNTFLHLACQSGHLEIVKLLLSKNIIEINRPNNNSETSLHLAAEHGHLEIVELLLTDNKININATNIIKDTPLCWACKNGHLAIVECLLKRTDIEIYTKTTPSMGPLHNAAEKGYLKIVELLLNHLNFDSNFIKTIAKEASFLAEKNNHTQIFALIHTKLHPHNAP